jgi:hypothetical protein
MNAPTAFDIIARLLDKQESMEYEIEAGKTALEEMSALADLYAKEGKVLESRLLSPAEPESPPGGYPQAVTEQVCSDEDDNNALRYQIATIRDELALISTGMSKDEMIHRVKSVINICRAPLA